LIDRFKRYDRQIKRCRVIGTLINKELEMSKEFLWIADRLPKSNDLTFHDEALVLRSDCMYRVAGYCSNAELFFMDGIGCKLGDGIVAWAKIESFEC